jgi:Domain of unknown function (DUF4189)
VWPSRASSKEKDIIMAMKSLGRLSRVGAAAIVVAAGATAVSLLGATATANAADQYVVVAAGLANDNPPVISIGGMAVGTDEQQTGLNALSDCQNSGGSHCVMQASAKNACAAAAANDYGEFAGATDPVLAAAESSAKSKLQNQQGAHVVVSGCTDPQQQQPPPNEPPAPKQGPTVSWDLVPGGFVAHITDRSGVTSQCTYVTDRVNRSFALPANSTYDLKVVPAVPLNRDYNVTITCDNGTSTQATHHF